MSALKLKSGRVPRQTWKYGPATRFISQRDPHLSWSLDRFITQSLSRSAPANMLVGISSRQAVQPRSPIKKRFLLSAPTAPLWAAVPENGGLVTFLAQPCKLATLSSFQRRAQASEFS